jgi:Domain of unknown function (DUF4342)
MEEQKATPHADESKPQPTLHNREKTWTEVIEVTGADLLASVKRLAAEGQVRRIRLIEPDGDIVLDMPLTIGAIAGGAIVLAAPLLAVLGALAAFVTKVRLEIVRNGTPPENKSNLQ